jgi:putative ABC transport system permease protein
MLKNYFKITIRNIINNKTYSVINILGFAISLSVVILLFLYVIDEFSTDKFHKNYNNIYRFQRKESANISPKYAEILAGAFPEVEKVTRITASYNSVIFKNVKAEYVENIYFADNNFFDVFTYESLRGDLHTALKVPNSVVLTESAAKKLFINEYPIGKILTLNNKLVVTVTAVIKDIPLNSSLNFSAVLPINYLSEFESSNWNNWESWNYEYYLLCSSQFNSKQFLSKLKSVFPLDFRPYTNHVEYCMVPFKQIYFDVSLRDNERHGSITKIFTLSTIGLMILIIAVINFINLSIVQSRKRSIEVGVRKTIGASRNMLIAQFLLESIILSLTAIIISLLFAEWFIPQFNIIFNADISFKNININLLIFSLIIGGILLGVFIGLYPGMYLSSFEPVNVLKGEGVKRRSFGKLNKELIVFQFVVSIGLIICTLVIFEQRLFIENRDLGFCKENVLFINSMRNIPQSFKDKLLKYHNIEAVAVASATPGPYFNSTETNWKYKGIEKDVHYLWSCVDEKYLPLMQYKLKEGRFFSREMDAGKSICIINEKTVSEFGIDDISQAEFNLSGNSYKVVGVVKDFNHESLHQEIQPFVLFSNIPMESGIIVLKIKTNNFIATRKTISYVQHLCEEYRPDVPFGYFFLDQWLDQMYKAEENTEKVIASFSSLAIFLACLGLFGLVSFSAEQRTKEIGIRKVMGASIRNIVLMLVKDFVKWILIANIIAWPVAYYFMNQWLQDFAYRINISWWIFLAAGSSALIIALATVSFQAIKAATANPVESLRYE